MPIYKQTLWPLLKQLDPERAHEATLRALALAQSLPPGRALLRLIRGPVPHQPIELFGLTFPNPLGVAAGFDKNARVVTGLAKLGFGHIEVGTLTPRPQAGNPRPRIFRLPADGALINRMGFPNEGAAAAVPRLWQLNRRPQSFILGVSLGKQKETPLAGATEDYLAVMRAVYPYADYLAVNVSSPNTPGLRSLQGSAYLDDLSAHLMAENRLLALKHSLKERPLLLKIAPDLPLQELEGILTTAASNGISGIIAANTTTSRAGLSDPHQTESGGLSGRPLAERSNEIIRYICQHSELPIIGAGGIFTAGDARAKLEAGASLVQLYTGLVYEGPGLPGRILRGLNSPHPAT